MDWFAAQNSEEDSEQEDHQDNKDDDEDEDPLDAYIKSLDHTITSKGAPRRAERLDYLNEEEATDHWRVQNTEKKKVSSAEHDDDDKDYHSEQKLAAQQALANTFHRAGQRKQKEEEEIIGGDDDSHDEQQQRPTKSTHTNNNNNNTHHSSNEPFRKSFWTPTDTPTGASWRKEHAITCHPTTVDPILSFTELSSLFGDTLLQKILSLYPSPTLVQSQTLPVVFSGYDAIVTASTGSGKTLAYLWPMIIHVCDQRPLQSDETGPIGLILVPTRELAQQVHSHVHNFFTTTQPHASSTCIIGGQSYQNIQQCLKRGVDIVVATPGRLLDVLKKGMSLSRTTMVVLDECDKMLSMGFEEQVGKLLTMIRQDRQTIMLSATMGRKVERVAQKWLHNNNNDCIRIAVGKTGEASSNVQQHVLVLPSYAAKQQWMLEMLSIFNKVGGKTLVFVATRAECEVLADMVREKCSIIVETLHGDKHQVDRNAALKKFSKGKLGALIATDVAARGLDIQDVTTVVNFDPAKNLDAHVHRVGRAGRLGRTLEEEGMAYTLLTPKNADFAQVLLNAFEREGREVTTELRELASKSRKAGNVAARTKWNKSGLGFHQDDPSSQQGDGSAHAAAGTYYGPSTMGDNDDDFAPPPAAKRSRWG